MDSHTKNIPDSRRIIPLLYKELEKNKYSGGSFKKTIFHIHTPASHDFTLINEETREKLHIKLDKPFTSWKQLKEEDLLLIVNEVKISPFIDHSIEDFTPYLRGKFENEKELLAYLILAHSLLIEDIELCLITDHNSIEGFDKLEQALNILLKEKKYSTKTRLEKGIEISCSDKNHIVGILDRRNQYQQNKLIEWLKENVLSGKEGTIRTSYDVFEMLKEIGAIGYIAHINSSDIFSKDFLSGTYKNQLFNSNLFNIIGINSPHHIPIIKQNILAYTKKKFHFIIDNDAHFIEKLKTSYFYIKGDKLNFETIKSALKDYDLSVSFEKQKQPKEYIKAIYIDGKEFLKGKDKHLIITFSSNMNAFIGGRGSGKSTILNTLGFITSQYIENIADLEKILKQGTSCVAYQYHNETYYIMLHSSYAKNNQIFTQNYFSVTSNYQNNTQDDAEKTRRAALHDRFQIFTYDGKNICEVTKRKHFMDKIFTPKFSTNELVNVAADEEELTKFINRTLFQNKDIRNKKMFNNIGPGINGLINKYGKKSEILNTRKKQVNELLNDYNELQKRKLRINFTQKNVDDSYFNWYTVFNVSRNAWDDYYKGYAITYENLVSYLQALSKQLGNSIETILIFNKKDFQVIFDTLDVKIFFNKVSTETTDRELKFIKEGTDLIAFFYKLRQDLVSPKSERYAKDFLKNYFRNSDTFTLEFNINNRESMKTEAINFQNIINLSMGQKVVAMLSFLLTYNEYLGDFKPFIIDQPEDNLDNQYIYKNLVADFKNLKSRRQIIVATHNSTIVMNSGCEQVIVMNSDNNNGWCETKGYISNPRISGYVVNILEGGTESIINKIFLYQENLKKKFKDSLSIDTIHILEFNNIMQEIGQSIGRISQEENPNKLFKLVAFLQELEKIE
ncbi:Spaf_1101 family AAA-like ATPase [Enterococcus faecium]|uniref:Spaf_1101 family AAA-like ATPase n=1 Tax=Enterococcus TaxID=1350 RepID=UPI000A351585|nr:AAA family ATPase [Enterococcus faecium]OTN78279.1 hypothetical protein A5826_002131 [Enterococcus faecium]